MKDKLVTIQTARGDWQLQWYLCEEDDLGLIIGELSNRELGKKEPKDRDDWENWIAHKIAAESKGVYRENPKSGPFYWESKKQADTALEQIKMAWKNRKTPLPDWAKKALTEGWKPPHGWNP